VLVAIRLPASDPKRDERLAQARLAASDSPLQIAEVGAELASLAAQTTRGCSPYLIGDAVAGAVLAEAACSAAAGLVEINLEGTGDDLRLRRAAALRTAAATARERALAPRRQR
jgi:formiminotetrahydrofolate cyclodeaminase